MDFNFGEIVEPASRAFYDDYDDPSLNLPFKRFVDRNLHCHCFMEIIFCPRPVWMWSSEDGKPPVDVKIQNLIVVDGTNALNIVNPSILKSKAPFAKLDGHKVELFQIEDFVVCVVEEKDLNYFATITELLEPWIKAAVHCSIVSLQSCSEFKSEEIPESSIIRSINSNFSDIPRLEVPNFITGAGAGIGTMRQMLDLPFSCYIIYIDLYDVFSIRLVLNLLKRLQLPHDESVPLKPLHQKSDLYM